MKVPVLIRGSIDIPNAWNTEDCTAVDVADFRYNDQLTEENTVDELARLLKAYPDDLEVTVG